MTMNMEIFLKMMISNEKKSKSIRITIFVCWSKVFYCFQFKLESNSNNIATHIPNDDQQTFDNEHAVFFSISFDPILYEQIQKADLL